MVMQEFAEQVAAHRPLLVKMARLRLRNDAWAEDAVSETLVAALENGAAFGGRASKPSMVGRP
jgi:RNA polymerase sigma-70 factor (ECF subfamily)